VYIQYNQARKGVKLNKMENEISNIQRNEIKKTSAEWIRESVFLVLDPDGWDRVNFDFSWNQEKITMAEFQRRLSRSTTYKTKQT